MADLEGMKLGNYTVLQRIGGGGMGDIYLAEHAELGRRVAVKVVREAGGQSRDPQANQRFARETRAVALLEHPHILPIYDYGEQDGVRYLVMQYVPDGSLADLLGPGPQHLLDLPLAPELAAYLIGQAAEALQYAHDRGVIHRDIKPHNLLVRVLSRAVASDVAERPQPFTAGAAPRLHVLLADFGLARFMAELASRTGTTGTPLYMAPEQYQGRPGPASDQYALACVTYLLLAGRPVFDGTVAELHHQHLVVRPAAITEANPHLPSALDAVVRRALAKDPQARFPAISDFALALADAAASTASTSPASGDWPPLAAKAAGASPVAASPPEHAAVPLPSGPRLPDVGQGVPRFPARLTGDEVEAASAPGGVVGAPMPSTPSSMPSGPYPMNAPTQPGGPSLISPPRPLSAAPSSPLSSPPARVTRLGAETPSVPPTAAGLPRAATPAPQGTAAVPGWRVPDAPGAPIPKPVSKRRRQWQRLSLRRKVAYIATALAVVLGVVASTAYVIAHRPQPPQMRRVAFGQVAHASSVNVSRLPDLTRSTTQATPRGQATLPVLPMHPGLGPQASDDHNPNLAPLPATIPDRIGDGAALRLESKFGPNQRQVGLSSPVDVSLGVSDHYVVQVVDGVIQIFGYQGQPDGPQLAAADFFGPLVRAGDALGEPRVLFDAPSQRWVLVMNETQTDGSGVINSYFDVAISQDDQPAGVWSLYQISTQEGQPARCSWADNPQLGSDGSAFYLSGTSFGCGGDTTFRGAMLWALPKRAFLSGKGTTYLRWQGVFTNAQHQPVLSVAPAVETGGESVEWLMSSDAGYVTGGKTSTRIIVWCITNPQVMERGQIPTLVGVVVTLPHPYADPPAAIQAGTSNSLSTGDARIMTPTLAGGHLYAAFTTAVNWQGDKTTRAAAYWLDLLPKAEPSPAGTPTATTRAEVRVHQAGLFGFAGGYTFAPSLAANASGDVALLVGAASPGITPSLVLGWRRAGDPLSAMGGGGHTVWLQKGASDAPYAGNHWGDYMGAGFAPGATGNKPAVWVAGPYMTDYPTQWQTLVWQMPL